MKITLDYGKTGLEVTLPDDRLIAPPLAIRPAEPLADPAAASMPRLANPTRREAARRTRPRQEDRMRRRLRHHPAGAEQADPAAGACARSKRPACRATGITILVATGLHRPNEGDELVELVGEDIAANYRFENHHGKDRERARLPRHDAQRRAGVDRQALHPAPN